MRIGPLPALLVLAPLLQLLSAPPASAAFSGAFGLLETELVRREEGLEGQTGHDVARQLAAVRTSLLAIRGADTLEGDCRAAGRVARELRRAFPSEFRAEAEVAADLSDLLGDAFQRLVDEVGRRRSDLADRALGLREPTAFRVERKVDAAGRRMYDALRAVGFRRVARRLAGAAATIARGTRIADADTVKDGTASDGSPATDRDGVPTRVPTGR